MLVGRCAGGGRSMSLPPSFGGRDLGGKLHRVESMTGGVAREASRERRSSTGRVPRDQPATVSSRYAQICSTTRRRFPDRLNSQPGALHISFHWTEGPVL